MSTWPSLAALAIARSSKSPLWQCTSIRRDTFPSAGSGSVACAGVRASVAATIAIGRNGIPGPPPA